MGEVGGRAHKEDSIAVDETGYAGYVDGIARCWTSDKVYLDAEVIACFPKCCVSSFRHDPEPVSEVFTSAAICTHISGSVTPRSMRPFCLALRHAINIDSVPPLVVTPAPPAGALNIASTMATTSASIFRTPGKTSGCIGFATLNFWNASACILIKSLPPWYTAPLTRPSSQRVCSISPSFSSSALTCSPVHDSFGSTRYRLVPGPLGTNFPSSFAIASAT